MGTLYIVATPIGNLGDITIRALKTLFTVDYIACEDTRRTGLLLTQLQKRYSSIVQTIKLKNPKLISYYDEVEDQKAPQIVDLIEQGYNFALISDAGTPLLSDPGYKLVELAIKRGITIVPIPGPSSITAALSVAGLPTNDFRFIGYLPSKRSKRLKKFINIITDTRPRDRYYTIVALEAPQRLRHTLVDIKSIFGNVDVVLAREMTKIHEEFIRGKIGDVLDMNFEINGEFVVLFTYNNVN